MAKEKLWVRDFVLITLINLLIFLSFQMLVPTMPLYAKSLGANDATLGWLIGIITVSSLLIRPFAGVALDRFGRSKIFLPSMLSLVILIFGYGWAHTVVALLVLRFLHGFGWGIASTASNTIAADVIPRARFGEGMGFFSLSIAVSLAVAPAFGLAILKAFGFFETALAATILVAAAFALSFFLGDRAAPQKVLSPNGSRAALFEKAAFRPAVIIFFISGAMGAISGFVSVYAYSIGITNIGPFFSIYAGAMILSRPIIGKLIDRFGFRVVVVPGFLLMSLALFLLATRHEAYGFYIAGACFGVGFATAQTSFQTMAVLNAPKARIGAANATFFTGFDGGIGFGAVCAGWVAGQWGYGNMYLFFLAFMLVAFLLYMWLGWGIKR